MSAAAPLAAWSEQRERGNASLVRLAAWLILHLGWLAGWLLLLPVTAWFIVSSGPARAASRGFLARALGRPVNIVDVSRHFFSFANVVLDRLFMLAGQLASYSFEVEGLEALGAELGRGRGCVLLGSHLGSFEALRAIATDCPQRIRPMMYRANAAGPTRLMEQLNPGLARDVIELGTIGAMLAAREAIGRGEIVGILGDRAHRGGKSAKVDFFGTPAAFPTGPILLAGTLGAPVFLFFAPRIGPRRYRIVIEPFCDEMRWRDGGRDATAQGWLAKYTARLEHHCRAHPFNWFNFFDFWGAFPDGGPDAGPNAGLVAGSAARPVDQTVPGLAGGDGMRPARSRGDGAAILGRDADAGLASVPERHERFTEEKHLSALDRPVVVAGELFYRQPGHLEKLTLQPRFERLTIDGDLLVLVDSGGAARRIDLGGQPELRGLTDAMRATLAGDISTLWRSFDVTLAGSLPAWRLTLVPTSAPVARLVEAVRIDGAGSRLTQIETVQANGDRSRMVIEPLMP